LLLYILTILVSQPLGGTDGIAVEKVCEIQADLTTIPQSELTRQRAPDGSLYYKLLYAIAMTFRNSITFELIYNGKTYETAFAKY
jgi:hypothetical protein